MDRFSSGLRRRATLIFVLGLLTWAGVQGALINIPLWTRALPPEPDDAYIYLSKAPQMAQCFIRQDCPALEDLRTQTDQAGKSAATAWEASRARVTAFTVYHPLHSALILGLHASGLSWETAYKVLCSAGSALFLLGLGLLLHALVGPGPAGAALFLLAFQVFPGQGLHYVVPSNLALGIAMVVWARILAHRGDCPWCLTLGTAAMLGMHPAGLLYSLVSLLLAFLSGRGAPRPGRRFAALAATALLTALGFILPLLSTHPELARAPEPLPDGFNPWMFALNTLREILGSLDRFTAATGAAILVLALLTGLRTLPAQRRTVLGRYCACVGLFLIAGLFHVMPHYPAEVFIRVWIPMAVGLAALAGYGLFKWLDLGIRLLGDRDGPLSDGQAFLTAPLGRRSLGLGLLLVLTAVLVQTARTGADLVLTAMDKASSRYDYAYNFEQPALLLGPRRSGRPGPVHQPVLHALLLHARSAGPGRSLSAGRTRHRRGPDMAPSGRPAFRRAHEPPALHPDRTQGPRPSAGVPPGPAGSPGPPQSRSGSELGQPGRGGPAPHPPDQPRRDSPGYGTACPGPLDRARQPAPCGFPAYGPPGAGPLREPPPPGSARHRL